jgi:hypothetical protein
VAPDGRAPSKPAFAGIGRGTGGSAGAGSGSIESIDSIGVTPPIALFEKAQPDAIAPASLPSRYTGLPLMPATIPEFSSPSPDTFTTIVARPDGEFGITPTTSTSNFSIASPFMTVKP